MKNLSIGVHVIGTNARLVIDRIVAAEQAGIQSVWMTSGASASDPLPIFAAAALKTNSIRLGTSIVPTYPRHPLALAQSAIVVDTLAPGRLRLGVGPSHKPTIEGTWGIPFATPYEHLREYLLVLRPLLAEGKVNFDGKYFKVHGQIANPIKADLLASALRPKSFELCGELADGAISWVCPLPYLRDAAVPAIRRGAAKAGRAAPPLIAHVPVVVCEDAAAVHMGALAQFAHYPRLPFYSQMFQDAGFPEAKEGALSERMINALVVHGSASQVKERLRQLPSFGAGELLATPVNLPGDEGALARTYAALGELAAE